MTEACYINKKNEKICLSITHHAKKRLVKRWPAAFPGKDIPFDIDMAIVELFNKAIRVSNFSRKEKTRLRRYGKDTLFFRNNKFTFVVKDAAIITVELSSKDSRRFNKKSSTAIKNHFEKENVTPEKQATSVKLSAFTLDEEMSPKSFNLGSYPLKEMEYDFETLKNETAFVDHIKSKINEKINQESKIIEILGYFKKSHDKFTIYNEDQIREIFNKKKG